MKILLDECLPRDLQKHLVGYDCQTVPKAGFAGKATGSSLLPDQRRQPPPAGAQAAPADLLVGPAVANVENFCSTCFHPHWGHSGGSELRFNTSFSKTFPQLEQAYSKIGMANRGHSLGLMSQLSGLEFPAGERKRPAQVKRESPGMRGRTTNQTTRKRTKIKKFSIVKLYAPCLGNRE